MRKRIFQIIEISDNASILGTFYDCIMIVAITASLVPLAFKADHTVFIFIDYSTVGIFIIDYLLRFITADYKFRKKSISSFARYPFSFYAIIDLISILPSLTVLHSGFKLLRLLRMMRAFRGLHIFKVLRYSKSMRIITAVFQKQKLALVAVGTLAIGYILVSALVVFNVEPDSFETFFNAIYWSTISLSSITYGEIYPTTTVGQVVSMVSSLVGIAIVALPTSIITAGYIDEINGDNSDEYKSKNSGEP
ncbi:MAG: ion transporter [Dehalococcoidia bacterium]|nr:ion transporter [Dehalococcoidia bacterium]